MTKLRAATVLVPPVVLLGVLGVCLLAGLDWVVALLWGVLAAAVVAALFFGYGRIARGLGNVLQQQRDQHKAEIKEISRVLYHARIAAGTATPGQSPATPGQVRPSPASRPGAAAQRPLSYPELVPPKVAPPPLPHQATYAERAHSPLPVEERAAWVTARQGGAEFRPTNGVPAHRAPALPFASEIPVAMIADDFTYNSFREEFRTFRLTPANWREVFEREKPELFLCESAWQGGPPQAQPWRGKVYASVRYPRENRGVLLEILDYCRKAGIPTAFWNKEDPTHFSDRINDFVRTACLFDYVFTTAEECLDEYVTYAGARYAGLLPFAVQPSLFNPRGSGQAEDVVNFAGTWYANYRDRSKRAEQLMDLVLASGRDLVIYNRMYDNKNPMYAFPERFQKFIRPAISHEETADAFRAARFGITLNTVTQSPTMFARRAFELAACGSVVLSNTSRGVERFFGDSVIYADREPQQFLDLSESDFLDLQHRAMRIALNNTSGHRAETILDTIGITHQGKYLRPAGLVFVSDGSEYDKALDRYRSNDGLDGMIAVTRRGGEQGLQMSLMRRHDKGVTVLTEDELASARYRTRSFLRSNGVVVADAEDGWGTQDDIEWLTAHATYERGLIRRAPDTTTRFQQATFDGLAGAYVPSALVSRAFGPERMVGYQV